jgi:hypothetical protein
MSIEGTDATALINKAKKLLKKEKNISPTFIICFEAILMLMGLFVNKF